MEHNYKYKCTYYDEKNNEIKLYIVHLAIFFIQKINIILTIEDESYLS